VLVLLLFVCCHLSQAEQLCHQGNPLYILRLEEEGTTACMPPWCNLSDVQLVAALRWVKQQCMEQTPGGPTACWVASTTRLHLGATHIPSR